MEAFDPFAVFGLPRRYDVDGVRLQREYLRLSGELHPDVLQDDPELGERSATLNRARQILEDPEQRAVALWKLVGGGVGGDDKSLPPGFLMEMMDIREQVEAPGADRAKWEAWAEDRRAEYQRRVGELFASATEPVSAALLKQMKLELNAWRYIERLIEQLS